MLKNVYNFMFLAVNSQRNFSVPVFRIGNGEIVIS